MCFPCRFLFLWIFFLPFFYFPVSILRILLKMTKKKRKFPTLRYERIICVCVIASLCERNFCVIMLRSRHSLDIFPGQEAEGGSLFLVTLLFLHRNKKVMWSFAINLKRRAFALLYSSLSSPQYFSEPFTSSWISSKERSFQSSSLSSSSSP